MNILIGRNRIHDNDVNNIAKWDLLHDIINHPKGNKN